jgi:hypothetical protein
VTLTMPSASRVARKSIRMLERQGLSRGNAAAIVAHVCDDAINRLRDQGSHVMPWWLLDVRTAAQRIKDDAS